jgi:murein DD-endopeptidase MepM/ murein hydrolase activator NlpD
VNKPTTYRPYRSKHVTLREPKSGKVIRHTVLATTVFVSVNQGHQAFASENDRFDTVSLPTDTPSASASEPAKAEADVIAFDPQKEYGEYKSHGKPMIATLTQKEVDAISNQFIRPVEEGTYKRISSWFAPRELRPNEEFHHGVDYSAAEGTNVYAAYDGKAVLVGAASGYGNWIVLEHEVNGTTLYSIYGHMKKEDLLIKEGDVVKQGDLITRVGNEGFSTAPHLHFSISKTRNPDSPRHFYDYIPPQMAVDIDRSTTYAYGDEPSAQVVQDAKELTPKQEAKKESLETEWNWALKASRETGWSPILILSQWQIETAHFSSDNFLNNHNIAGQTWHEGIPESMKGSARPIEEGGHYIKYSDPVEGYISFILENPRYDGVKEQPTPELQAAALAKAGWAVDPNYQNLLHQLIQQNRGIYGDWNQDQVAEVFKGVDPDTWLEDSPFIFEQAQ